MDDYKPGKIYHLNGTYSEEFASSCKEDSRELAKLSEMFQFDTGTSEMCTMLPDSKYTPDRQVYLSI